MYTLGGGGGMGGGSHPPACRPTQRLTRTHALQGSRHLAAQPASHRNEVLLVEPVIPTSSGQKNRRSPAARTLVGRCAFHDHDRLVLVQLLRLLLLDQLAS